MHGFLSLYARVFQRICSTDRLGHGQLRLRTISMIARLPRSLPKWRDRYVPIASLAIPFQPFAFSVSYATSTPSHRPRPKFLQHSTSIPELIHFPYIVTPPICRQCSRRVLNSSSGEHDPRSPGNPEATRRVCRDERGQDSARVRAKAAHFAAGLKHAGFKHVWFQFSRWAPLRPRVRRRRGRRDFVRH